MTSIVKSILKHTVGFLLNKGRDLMAEKLKDGDVTDQQFRKLILRELDDFKSKLDGLARKDLLASLIFFREGIDFLYQVFDQQKATRPGIGMKDEKPMAYPLPSLASNGSELSVNTNFLPLLDKNEMSNLNDLSETSSKQLLLDAKERFKDARKKAVEAFSNEALKTTDRLLALKIRILATIMEKIDCPTTALQSCRLCLEELHNMPVVQNYFSVEITKSVKSLFKKHERRELIANVCEMNYAVHTVTKMVRGVLCDQLPFITINHQQIDPLRDPRLVKVLKEFKLEHCILPAEWTFGCEGERSHRLHCPSSITTNTQGQFIVADNENVKVFDPLGKFLYSVLGSENRFCMTAILATDRNDNLYLCTESIAESPEIRVFDRNHNLHHRLKLRAGVSRVESFTISNDDQVFVVVRYGNDGVHKVDEYENDGRFVHSFGKDVLSQNLWSSHSITTSGDGVMILDGNTKCVHVFSAQGAHLYKFKLNECDRYCHGIVFFEPNQHVVILSHSKNENRGQLLIYTKDGALVRSVQLDTDIEPNLDGITVTVEGQVAVTNYLKNKVHVLQL